MTRQPPSGESGIGAQESTSTGPQSGASAPEAVATEYVACPLCNERDSTAWGSENGWDAGKCNGCGAVYVNPRPSEEEIGEAAKTGMHRVVRGVINRTSRFNRRKVRDCKMRLLEVFSEAELEELLG